MKRFILLTLLSTTLILADQPEEITTQEALSTYLTETVNSVEKARKDALDALDKMVGKVDLSQSSAPTTETSISYPISESKFFFKVTAVK